MSKSRDDNLTKGPDPLRDLGKRKFTERAKEMLRSFRPARLPRTPKSQLKRIEKPLQSEEKKLHERSRWVEDHWNALDKRERAEMVSISCINTFVPVEWITAGAEQRLAALQALNHRLKAMQGRTDTYKVEQGVLDKFTGAVTDHEAKTITLNRELVASASPRLAAQALMAEIHLLMQREAVRDPVAFAEHGIDNIQRWAEPLNGQPRLSRQDAVEYAIRQTLLVE